MTHLKMINSSIEQSLQKDKKGKNKKRKKMKAKRKKCSLPKISGSLKSNWGTNSKHLLALKGTSMKA